MQSGEGGAVVEMHAGALGIDDDVRQALRAFDQDLHQRPDMRLGAREHPVDRALRHGSIPAPQARQPPLELDLLRAITLRIVEPVGRIEADQLALAAQGLQRRFHATNQSADDLAIARRVAVADQGIIAYEYAESDPR